MRTLFSGEVHVHYGQAYVESEGCTRFDDLDSAFVGQSNGLCGGALPGALFLITGLHTGNVGFTVELHEQPPPVDEAWQEIVEVSFTPASSEVALVEWGGGDVWGFDLERTEYRARYCASGMDEAHSVDTRIDDEPLVDSYLLQFWPSATGPDRVVKRTSEEAAYWHRFARELPPPPSPEEKADAEHRARLKEQWLQQRFHFVRERQRWSGALPGERLRNVGGNASDLASFDRELVEAVADADPELQRRIACWAARRAYTLAGLAEIDWVAPALAAVERERELPAPFENTIRVWQLFSDDERVPDTAVITPDGSTTTMSQQAVAVPALFGAAEADPLRAALDALHAAMVTFGSDHRRFLDEAHETFFPAAQGCRDLS